MRIPTTIKQIMPIENGYTVLSVVEDDEGNFHMENLTYKGWHYMYALIDGCGFMPDAPALYTISPDGIDSVDDGTSRVVPKRKCPVCGYDMTPIWDDEVAVQLQYFCPKCSHQRRKADGAGGGMDVHQSL